MFELTVRDEISAAHFLRDYEGQCCNLHGHTWRVDITVAGEQLDALGMMIDFVGMKRHLKAVLSRMDHACLNDLEYFKEHNPTAENLARYIFIEYKPLIAPVSLVKVRVWESAKADVVYYE
jgi:6-pyruvoyltetrahydropterin/6-carboxytetrahydropterin synthase